MNAQVLFCSPQANFTFQALSDCDYVFIPFSAAEGSISHFWTFTDAGGGISTSNVPSPQHTFGLGATLTQVTHTLTITLNGTTTQFTCAKSLQVGCNHGCSGKSLQENIASSGLFQYAVTNCSVSFFGGGNWDFGDGSFANGINPTHTYAQSGMYTVTNTVDGVSCSRKITVSCADTCCTADFAASVRRECSALFLDLDPVCKAGTHKWELLNTCAQMEGSPLQVTRLNTNNEPSLQIRHTYTCANGQTLSQIKTLPIADPGIYIGLVNQTTKLTRYECALPGALYNGSLPVYVTGVVETNKPFAFEGTNVWMHPDVTGFDVIQPLVLRSDTKVRGSLSCNCMWRGIYVWGTLQATDAEIGDALFGVRAHAGCVLTIDNTLFKRNFIGIRSTEEAAAYTRRIKRSTFDGAGPLKNICGINGLKNDITARPFFNNVLTTVPFFNVRGFAGIYVRENAIFDFPGASFSTRNLFKNLVVGLDIYDTNTRITGQAQFEDIHAETYEDFGTAGLRFTDANINSGGNTLFYRGNRGIFGTDPDFTRSTCGILVQSEMPGVAFGGTPLTITNCKMTLMQEAVLLYANKGAFGGYPSNPTYKGVYNNELEASNYYIGTLYGGEGVRVINRSPSQSLVGIYDNDIVAREQMNGIVVGHTAYPGPEMQYDIYRNGVGMTPSSSFGIGVEGGRAWIRDNSTVARPGAGIFIAQGSQEWNPSAFTTRKAATTSLPATRCAPNHQRLG